MYGRSSVEPHREQRVLIAASNTWNSVIATRPTQVGEEKSTGTWLRISISTVLFTMTVQSAKHSRIGICTTKHSLELNPAESVLKQLSSGCADLTHSKPWRLRTSQRGFTDRTGFCFTDRIYRLYFVATQSSSLLCACCLDEISKLHVIIMPFGDREITEWHATTIFERKKIATRGIQEGNG